MAVIATVDKFGITFSDAYHKVTRLTYESTDQKEYTYAAPSAPAVDEDGNPVPPVATPPVETWVKKNFCHFEVATYASTTTREAHAEPIYRTHYNFQPIVEAEAADILVQAYDHLKAQAGYEDAVDC
jgi:hypothetical protein